MRTTKMGGRSTRIMTNYEWIMSLSKESLAIVLSEHNDRCDYCACKHCDHECFKNISKWMDEKHTVIEYFEEAEDE